ncbi:MAG: cytochrome P450 [Dehalococcoidia bacterium]
MATDTATDPTPALTRAYLDNPYPTLKHLRDNHPVYKNPQTGGWLITRYDDVVKTFKDIENFSASPNADGIGAVFGSTLMEYDGDKHNRLRNIVAPEFVGRKLEVLLPIIERNTQALIEKYAEKHAARLAADAHAKGEIDIVDDFATRLPLNVILDVLGLPKESHELFHDWYPAMMNGIGGGPELRKLGVKANGEYHDYLDPLVKQRSVNPGEDLISQLCIAEVDGHRMTHQEIKSFASLLLVAGAETTDKAIANLWYWLLSNPREFERVREDPDLLDNAFTEMMRVHPPSGGQARRAINDVAMYDQVIKAGDYVQLSIYGGNRDDRVFKDPDTFDILRDDLYFGKELRSGYHEGGKASHLGFGLGKHFCVGYQLARTETVIGSKALMKMMNNPRFKPGFEARPIAISIQPWQLLLEFDPA